MASPSWDLLIVGGGPVGLFACFYAGMRGMSTVLVDSLEQLGGQVATLYPEKYIYDVGGFPKILAKDLVANLIEQGLQFNPTVRLGAVVSSLERRGDEFVVSAGRGEVRARSIVVAAGLGAFSPKKLPMPGAADYEGKGLLYFVPHVADLRGKSVLVIGGGDSAVDWANALGGVAGDLTLIHRRDVFRAHEKSVERMRAGPTRVLPFHELRRIEGEGRVERAVIYDNRTNQEQTLKVDVVVAAIGFNSSLGPIAGWNLELDGSSIRVDSTMQTSREGIFAAGDVVSYPGKLKLIATGFGEACVAVNHAKAWIDPSSHAFPGHSSEFWGK